LGCEEAVVYRFVTSISPRTLNPWSSHPKLLNRLSSTHTRSIMSDLYGNFAELARVEGHVSVPAIQIPPFGAPTSPRRAGVVEMGLAPPVPRNPDGSRSTRQPPYRIRLRHDPQALVLAMAPHGGLIEFGTCAIARAVAARVGWAHYTFEGHGKDAGRLHITSTHFDAPLARELARAALMVVTFHGEKSADPEEIVFLGGRLRGGVQSVADGKLTTIPATRPAAAGDGDGDGWTLPPAGVVLRRSLERAGFIVRDPRPELRGLNPDNICNAGGGRFPPQVLDPPAGADEDWAAGGLQLEMNTTLRGRLLASPTRMAQFAACFVPLERWARAAAASQPQHIQPREKQSHL
jgi:phage replication-related protein YjqB (UPF0714/DUF867 family)